MKPIGEVYFAVSLNRVLNQLKAIAGIVIFVAMLSVLIVYLRHLNQQLQAALKKISDIAIRDQLTGLYNRHYMTEVLDKQKAMADRGQHQFVICYLDLDHFKKINDTFGHNVGDEVLKIYAELVSSEVRTSDYCGRFGGEEYVVVLVQTAIEAAATVAERIRTAIEGYDYASIADNLKVTVSIGITTYRRSETLNETLARADGALYEAKASGRNQVVAK